MQQPKPTHRMHHPLHDYREACIYHVTVVCSGRAQILGRIAGTCASDARCELSPLGYDISQEIQAIPTRCASKGRKVQILAKVVMPEHVHFVLYVKERLDIKMQLIMRGFKQGCNKALRKWLDAARALEEAEAAGRGAGRRAGGAERRAAGDAGGAGRGAGLEKPAIPNSNATQPLTTHAWRQEAEAAGEKEAEAARRQGAEAAGEREAEATRSQEAEAAGKREAEAARSQGAEAAGEREAEAARSQGAEAAGERGAEAASKGEEAEAWMQEAVLLRNAAFLRQLRALARRHERIGTLHALFEEDFDETRLRRRGQLDTMIRYVHNNPSHRWLKMHHRDLLMPIRHIPIAGHHFDAIGNVNLLALPRQQVHVRSRWTPQQRRDYMNNCILKARHGYALVSPFISEWEKAVQNVALQEGHSVVILCDNGFSDFTQCPGNLYEYCLQGQVLLLADSQRPRIDRKASISRQECVALNDMATAICEEMDQWLA